MSEPFNPFAAPETRNDVQAQTVGSHQELAGVERGLRLIYFGICGVFLSAMATAVLAVAIGPSARIGFVGVIISWLMVIIGPFFCLSVPAESKARGLIGASILFQLTGFLLMIGWRTGVIVLWPGADLSPALQLLSQFSGVSGGVLFILFLMKVARFIGREDLRRRGINLLIGSVVLFLITVFAVYSVTFFGRANTESIGLIAIFLAAAGALVLFLMYANLVNYLAKAIGSLRSGSAAGQETGRYLG